MQAVLAFHNSARIILHEKDGKLSKIELLGNPRFPVRGLTVFAPPGWPPSVQLSHLSDYLTLKSCRLDSLPVELSGLSDFTKRVLEHLRFFVGCGETITYGELARRLGTSPRAVGQAMRRNPIPVVIPCHRVVSRNGMGGYSAGIRWKKFLLEVERAIIERTGQAST